MNKLAVGIFFCFTLSVVHAQKYWTLDECVNTGLKNNLSLKQKELTQQSAQADYFQSKMGLLPNLNGSVSNNWNTGFAINPVTNSAIPDATFRSNNFSISSSVTLFNGFQNVNNTRLQKNNTMVYGQDYVSTKNTIALQICNSFLQALLSLEILESRKLQNESTKLQLAKQEKLYELGGSSKTKLLQLRAQQSTEELNVVQAESQLSQAYLTLWQSMNILPDTSNHILKPSLDASKVEDELKTSDQVFETYIQNSPEVKAAELRTKSAELTRMMALGGRSPRITLSGGVNSFYSSQNQEITGYSYSLEKLGLDASGNPSNLGLYYLSVKPTGARTVSFADQFDKNLGKNIGLSLSMPIFNGYQANNNIKKSSISLMSANLNEQQVKNDTYKSVNQAYLDFKTARKKYDANLNNLDANKESANLAEAQFSLGAIGMNDYLQTKNAYLQAETNYLQAKYELIFRRKVLDFYLGKPLY